MNVTAVTAEPPLRWRLLSLIGAVSIVTLPLTAIWFLFLGCATLTGTAAYAAATGPADQAAAILRTGASIGIGLILGPILYLVLWSLS